ncbi:hypothetical protein F4819DRAFT_401053 [Hypoxylon fuscum]|nr:hypothetical protein F4819DRAFT_401053 [Hypoxylon fuscum]
MVAASRRGLSRTSSTSMWRRSEPSTTISGPYGGRWDSFTEHCPRPSPNPYHMSYSTSSAACRLPPVASPSELHEQFKSHCKAGPRTYLLNLSWWVSTSSTFKRLALRSRSSESGNPWNALFVHSTRTHTASRQARSRGRVLHSVEGECCEAMAQRALNKSLASPRTRTVFPGETTEHRWHIPQRIQVPRALEYHMLRNPRCDEKAWVYLLYDLQAIKYEEIRGHGLRDVQLRHSKQVAGQISQDVEGHIVICPSRPHLG